MNTATQRATLICAIVLFGFFPSVHARDCSTSKQFQLKKTQALAGILQDPVGAELSGVELDLLYGKNRFRHLRTDSSGKYDFGEVPAGRYRLHVQFADNALCAPKVRCDTEGCTIEPRLKVSSRDMVTVY